MSNRYYLAPRVVAPGVVRLALVPVTPPRLELHSELVVTRPPSLARLVGLALSTAFLGTTVAALVLAVQELVLG